SEGEDRYRRGVYTFIKRTSPYPSFMSFDASSREICQIQRTRTNTPLQALVTLNDPVYTEAALAWADRLLIGKGTVEQWIQTAYYEATFRNISEVKMASLLELYQESVAHFEEDEETLLNYLNMG